MSLGKKLWAAIVIIMSVAFVGTFVVSTVSAQRYFTEQLYVKNVDNATSLALSISQMDKDPVTLELMLSAQFDAGHYRLIRLTDPSGRVIVERQQKPDVYAVPNWFKSLVPISAQPGMAQVQDQWKPFGQIELQSHNGYAYEELWHSTGSLLIWFLITALLTGLIGTSLLRLILHPLDAVVEQAKAIGERRFITNPEPSTTEFRQLVRIMNTLSGRVRKMLSQESKRVDELRQQAQIDAVSGLYNRDSFLNALASRLSSEEHQHSFGLMFILRMQDPAILNETLGWQSTDQIIHTIGKRLTKQTQQHAHWVAGRLSGSEFGLLTPPLSEPEAIIQQLLTEIKDVISEHSAQLPPSDICGGACHFVAGESQEIVLARVDSALAQFESTGKAHIESAIKPGSEPEPTNVEQWRSLLQTKLTRENLELGSYPVISSQGETLHLESPARLKVGQSWWPAGRFVPWVSRLHLTGQLDQLVFDCAVDQISSDKTPRAINLSLTAITDQQIQGHMLKALEQVQIDPSRLWFDVPEYYALEHQPEFRTFCMTFKPLGCKIGIKHAGPGFSRIGELHDIGLSYLKVDASIIRKVESNPGNQAFLRGLCMVAHAIDLTAIALGVSTQAEKECLINLGIDAVTGPGVSEE